MRLMLASSPLPARIELRQATAVVHERLHHVPIFAALAEGRLDHVAYVGLLGRLYGFHDPFEAAIDRVGPPGLQPVQWRRAHLLRSDIAALGQSEAAIRRLPRHAVVGSRWTPARAMGVLYVIEGSTLGGRLLARQLDHVVGGDNKAGRSFLLAGTGMGHVRWGDFCAALDACGTDAAARAEMVAGAIETFRAFEAWFV